MGIRRYAFKKVLHNRANHEKTLTQQCSRRRSRKNYKLAARFVKGKHVLDIGAGHGYGYEHVLAAGPKSVTCIDKSAESLKGFLYDDNRISFIVSDFMENDFKANSFDTVLCLAVLLYSKREKAFLKEIKRILKPGGTLVISQLDKNYLKEVYGYLPEDLHPGWGKVQTTDEFAKMIYDTFKVKPQVYIQTPLHLKPAPRRILSKLTLQFRLAFGRQELHPKKRNVVGFYNYCIVRTPAKA